ncbi:MAG: hypothetical protein K8T90_15875 [Planctomycetes bacterium]|nr:hypothetical protein [Planctomycetota bacterium]
MKKIAMLTTAAMVGAVAVLAAEPALAKKAAPQSFSCRTSKGAYKDNALSRQGTAMLNVAHSTFFNYALFSNSFKISGRTATTSSWLMPCLSTKDIRTPGVLPLTFHAGGSDDTVAGSFAITKGASVIGSWVTDDAIANPFSVTFKSYNATTSRLVGTFGGTLAPGDTPANQKANKVSGGKFNVTVNFNGF